MVGEFFLALQKCRQFVLKFLQTLAPARIDLLSRRCSTRIKIYWVVGHVSGLFYSCEGIKLLSRDFFETAAINVRRIFPASLQTSDRIPSVNRNNRDEHFPVE